ELARSQAGAERRLRRRRQRHLRPAIRTNPQSPIDDDNWMTRNSIRRPDRAQREARLLRRADVRRLTARIDGLRGTTSNDGDPDRKARSGTETAAVVRRSGDTCSAY